MTKTLVTLFFLTILTIGNAQTTKEFADSVRKAYNIPELSYAIISSDKIIEIQALGTKKINSNSKAELTDKFRIGSNTKTVTSYIATLLVKEGKIKWNTKFFDLYPELKLKSNPAYHDLTLQDLITFRAKIISWTYGNETPTKNEINGTEQEQRNKFVSWILKQKPVDEKQELRSVAGVLTRLIRPFCFRKLLGEDTCHGLSGVEIEGFYIWGSPISPISPKFGGDWAFNIDRGQKIRKHWELIPENTDILITHCPPFGILDMNDLGDKEGCKDLLDLVQNKIKPRVHIFGHIHEAYGQVQIGQTKYINASVVGLQSWIANYKLTRQLRIFAISIFQTIKQIRKSFFGVQKGKLHNRTINHLHWTVKNPATIIDI